MKLIVKFCELYREEGADNGHVVPILYYEDGTVVEAQRQIVVDSGGPNEPTTVTVTFLANVATHGVHIEPQTQKRPLDRM